MSGARLFQPNDLIWTERRKGWWPRVWVVTVEHRPTGLKATASRLSKYEAGMDALGVLRTYLVDLVSATHNARAMK